MTTFLDDIAQEFIDYGFPEKMSQAMALGVKEKIIRNMTVKHRDLPVIAIFGIGDITTISTDVDKNIK